MAEGGREGGRERELPRGRNAAGRSGLTPAVQRVPALRAGRVVRAGREATSPRAGLPRPLCGRLRDGLPRPERCPACAGRPTEAIRQVRPDRSPDQDEARAVLPAALPGRGAERIRSPSSWDLRPAGIHPLLGPIPAWSLGDQTEDRREPLQPGGAEHRPVVPGEAAHVDRRATTEAEREATRT